MIPTLPLRDIWETWRNALSADQAIQDYCQGHYGRPCKVFVGLHRKRPPTEADCPLIVLRPGAKDEGDQEANSYSFSIGWAIVNETQIINGNVLEMAGAAECDDLGQLILDCLQRVSPEHPITAITYEIEPIEFFPQFRAEMLLRVDIERVIGAGVTYP